MAQEAVVLSDEQVRLHDSERVERDTDDDEQRRAAEEGGYIPRNVHPAHEEHRDQRDDEKPRAADERDLRHHVVKIFSRGASGADAGQIRAVFLQVLGDVDGVKLRSDPEEREEHDERGVDDEVQRRGVGEILREAVESSGKTSRRRVGHLHDERARNLNERLREDDGHDARVVDSQRHERLLHAVGVAAADAATRRVDGDLPDALREHHRAHDDEEEEDHENRKLGDGSRSLHARETEVTLPSLDESLRKARGDVDHDDERSAVADAEGRDLIGEPHDEERGARHADNGHEVKTESGIRDDLNARERRTERAGVAEHRGDAPRLDDTKDNRQVARNLRELLTTALPFFLELFKRRNDRAEKLNDD